MRAKDQRNDQGNGPSNSSRRRERRRFDGRARNIRDFGCGVVQSMPPNLRKLPQTGLQERTRVRAQLCRDGLPSPMPGNGDGALRVLVCAAERALGMCRGRSRSHSRRVLRGRARTRRRLHGEEFEAVRADRRWRHSGQLDAAAGGSHLDSMQSESASQLSPNIKLHVSPSARAASQVPTEPGNPSLLLQLPEAAQ